MRNKMQLQKTVLNVITLGPRETFNINQMISITEETLCFADCIKAKRASNIREKFLTLIMITLSSFNSSLCFRYTHTWGIKKFMLDLCLLTFSVLSQQIKFESQIMCFNIFKILQKKHIYYLLDNLKHRNCKRNKKIL